MENNQTVRDVQMKILEIMKYIDRLCRDNGIIYFIMGGTALGAVRHGGFIPWDDDLDIFMTPENYVKFKNAFDNEGSDLFIIQEWRIIPEYLEYAKVRMNGTTFIESSFKDRNNMHHGIYVDIMILHKAPKSKIIQMAIYLQSKFVTLYALSQRNWIPKSRMHEFILFSLKFFPKKLIALWCYKNIYRYDNCLANYVWCYFITPASFKQGIFDKTFFDEPEDIYFDNTMLMGPKRINDYLSFRYGDYMKLPSEENRKASVHAEIYDIENSFEKYVLEHTLGLNNDTNKR